MRVVLPLLLGLAFESARAAESDPASPPGVTSYPAAYFSDVSPTTALDMVRRLPGFTLVEADPDVRGYAGAQGNVLIDGARPASKREPIEALLRRIPAHAVERIELVRDGASGFDLLGQPVIANVVRRVSVETGGAIEAGTLLDVEGGTEGLLRGEFARQWSERALELAASSVPDLDDESGDGRITTRAPDGALLESADRSDRHVQRVDQVVAGWRQPTGGGKLQLDAAWRRTEDDELETIASDFPDPSSERVDERERLQELEASLRYERELGARSRAELLASHRSTDGDERSVAVEDDELERFEQDTDGSEDIVRVELHHARSKALNLDASLEVARNTLDGDASLVEDGEPVALPGSLVRIVERRAEGALLGQWQASPAWRVEGGLALEYSRIRQTGDTRLTRDFTDFKPTLTVRWQRSDEERWRWSIAREVGQLDFEDFVASAALDTDVVSAGNAELEPERTWRATLAWERDFGPDATLALTYTHDWIDDAIDRVLVVGEDELFDAPGNIGSGRRDVLALGYRAPLSALGLPAWRVDAGVEWRHTRVTDPTTRERRSISDEQPLEGSIELSHRPPGTGFAWGFGVDLQERETEYRFDEVSIETGRASWGLFAQQTLDGGWRVRAEVSDMDFGIEERRKLYDGPRSDVPLEEIETRRHRVPTQILLTIRREFGG